MSGRLKSSQGEERTIKDRARVADPQGIISVPGTHRAVTVAALEHFVQNRLCVHIICGGCHDTACIGDRKDLDERIHRTCLTLLELLNMAKEFIYLQFPKIKATSIFRTEGLPSTSIKDKLKENWRLNRDAGRDLGTVK